MAQSPADRNNESLVAARYNVAVVEHRELVHVAAAATTAAAQACSAVFRRRLERPDAIRNSP
jgi:hypothetical protein